MSDRKLKLIYRIQFAKKVILLSVVVLALMFSFFLFNEETTGFSTSNEGISYSADSEGFTLVVLPDTQLYTYPHRLTKEFNVEIFLSQTEWIKNNVEKENIVFVAHEGDIVGWPYDVGQWENADEAMSVLDGEVPYILNVGNHDMGSAKHYSDIPNDRDTTNYNKYFPYTRYENEEWYGGHMGGDNDNYYVLFSVGELDFMIITLEFGPTKEILDWASGVVEENSDRRVIVVTHAYMYYDDTRLSEGDNWRPQKYDIEGDSPYDGEGMWNEFVRKHENIFLVLSGHVIGDGTARLTSIGDNGNEVHQVLANYQFLANGGGGWLRLMKFVPSENKIYVETYSPWYDEFNLENEEKRSPWIKESSRRVKAEKDSYNLKDENSFALEYDMS